MRYLGAVLLVGFIASSAAAQEWPVGAIAMCQDGRFVFVTRGARTCDSGGGVAQWRDDESKRQTEPKPVPDDDHHAAKLRALAALVAGIAAGPSAAGTGLISGLSGNAPVLHMATPIDAAV